MSERRPSYLNRGLSTPPSTMAKLHDQKSLPPLQSINPVPNLLTPPTSPRSSRSFSNLSEQLDAYSGYDDSTSPEMPNYRESSDVAGRGRNMSINGRCPFDVEILSDQHGQPQIFGEGAWSIVYRGTAHQRWQPSVGLDTPPSSPASTPPAVVAVKTAARPDARQILRHEARIFTHLNNFLNYDQFVIPFHGADQDDSLILGTLPLSLEDHIKKRVMAVRGDQTIIGRSDPIIGSTRVWLDLAHRLISGLQWLHQIAGVVHGDIKPGNILLSPKYCGQNEFAYDSVFIDFSSSQVLHEEPAENTLSAVTTQYTAPELLTLAVMRNPKSTATTASDVFSMAVTLLAAAIGNTLIYPGSSFQRQIMATSGWLVLSNARNDESGYRIPRHGVVERTLERAVLKANMGRLDTDRWLEVVELQRMGGPSKR